MTNKQESTGLKFCKDPKAFIEYSNDMDDIYKSTGEHSLVKNTKYWLHLVIWMLYA